MAVTVHYSTSATRYGLTSTLASELIILETTTLFPVQEI